MHAVRAWSLPAVFVGGAAGTLARLGIDLLLPHAPGEVPWSTLLINVVGGFLLGLGTAALWDRIPVWLRDGLGIGLIGGFTTFSAFSVAVVFIAAPQSAGLPATVAADPGLALLVVIGGFCSSVAASWLGLAIGRSIRRYGPKTPEQVQAELEADE